MKKFALLLGAIVVPGAVTGAAAQTHLTQNPSGSANVDVKTGDSKAASSSV